MDAPEPLAIDPFCSAANPAHYVARPATEEALAALRAALEAGPGAIALVGPGGIGKSMLVRVLETRLAGEYTFVCLQATPPSRDQVCEAALHALGDAPGPDVCGALALRAALLARRGRPLVLVLDAVETLLPDALPALSELPLTELRAVMVASHREGLEPALSAFGPELRRISLDAPLSRAENEEYLRARLEHADAPPELRARLHAEALDLWRASRGNPQRLHAEVSQVQLELWRATAAEPLLQRLEAESEPLPFADLIGEELHDLEIGDSVLPVPPVGPVEFESPEPSPQLPDTRASESPAAPQAPPASALADSPAPGRARLPEPLPETVLAPKSPAPAPVAPARMRRLSFASFALGAVCGGTVTALAMVWLRPQLAPPAPAERPRVVQPVRPEPVEPRSPPEPSAASPDEPLLPPATPPAQRPMPPPAPDPVAREAEAEAPPPAVRVGSVRVHVQALPWATIYVDGELVGETPLGNLKVAAGTREFLAEMPDGRTLRKRVQVQDGTRVLFQ